MTTLATRRSPERQQFLLDVLTTACEGGINYWAFLDDYDIWVDPSVPTLELVQQPDPQLRIFDFIAAEDLVPADAKQIWVDDYWKTVANEQGWEALPKAHRHLLNVDVIARGLRALWEAGYDRPDTYWHQLRKADRTNGRDGDYDTGLADSVVQFGLFGEGLYG